jgi:hypothetical protein
MMALATVMVIIAAFITVSLINRLMAGSIRSLEERLSLPEESLLGFTRVLKGIVWLIAALLILSLWGVSVSGLWTLLVSAATIIGVGFLAVWEIFVVGLLAWYIAAATLVNTVYGEKVLPLS